MPGQIIPGKLFLSETPSYDLLIVKVLVKLGITYTCQRLPVISHRSSYGKKKLTVLRKTKYQKKKNEDMESVSVLQVSLKPVNQFLVAKVNRGSLMQFIRFYTENGFSTVA